MAVVVESMNGTHQSTDNDDRPPSLPFDPSRHQVWTVRLPADLDVRALDGQAINVGATMDVGGRSVRFHMEDAVDDSIRVLHGDTLVGVHRHVTVRVVEPAAASLSAAAETEVRRRPYAAVDQLPGLRRRFQPIGAGSVTMEPKRPVPDDNKEDKKAAKKARKAAKRARKEKRKK